MANPHLTWNDIPLLVPDVYGELEQWLRQFQSVADVIQFCGVEPARIGSVNAPQSIAGTGISSPNYPPLPPLAVNELIMPTGATRFGYFVGLLPVNSPNIGANGSQGTLVISDGTNTTTVKMNVLAYRPVTAFGDLAMIVLVDQRYYWQFMDCGNILAENGFPLMATTGSLSGTPNNDYGTYGIGYSEVFLALEQRMGVTFDRSTVSGFLSLDVLELTNRKFFNAAMMLDAVASSCGLRVWVGFDGTINVKDSTITPSGNFENKTNLMAGGLFPTPEKKPGRFQVNFPRASWFHSYADGDRYTIENNISGSSDNPGYLTVDSCCYAHWTTAPDNYVNLPDNSANLQSLASNIQSGVMQWWGSSYDATWTGVKTWTQSGFDNFIAIRYAVELANRAYNVAVESDAKPKENTKFDLNLLAFTTRIQSMPNNFGTRVNLSQDPSITFLRGWQWGKLATESVPAVINGDGVRFPQPTLVNIWQFDSQIKESNTGFQVQAFDVADANSPWPSGSRVMLFWHEVNRCWKYRVIDDNSTDVVQVAWIEGFMLQKNARCLYGGSVVKVNTDNTPCGPGFWPEPITGQPCWLVTLNNDGEAIGYVYGIERYIGKLIGVYSIGGESPALPLYAIKEAHHLIRFQLINPLEFGVTPENANAVQIQWDNIAFGYEPIGNLIRVVDPYARSEFDTGTPPLGAFSGQGTTSLRPGYRGYAEWKPDRQVYEIVWMQHRAIFIQFRLNEDAGLPLGTEKANAQVVSYWQGVNPDPTNIGIEVFNMPTTAGDFFQFAAPKNAVGFAVWDDRLSLYRISSIQTKPQFIIGTLASAISEGGSASGAVTYAWSAHGFVALTGNVSLVDKTDPKIFTGSIGNQYHATYDAMLDKYVITWVQCS